MKSPFLLLPTLLLYATEGEGVPNIIILNIEAIGIEVEKCRYIGKPVESANVCRLIAQLTIVILTVPPGGGIIKEKIIL